VFSNSGEDEIAIFAAQVMFDAGSFVCDVSNSFHSNAEQCESLYGGLARWIVSVLSLQQPELSLPPDPKHQNALEFLSHVSPGSISPGKRWVLPVLPVLASRQYFFVDFREMFDLACLRF